MQVLLLWWSTCARAESRREARNLLRGRRKVLVVEARLIMILMSTPWFVVFEANETYGYPLTKNRMLNYKNKVLNLKNKDLNPKNTDPENQREKKELTPAEVLPAGKSQEGDHTELFTLWSQLNEPNTRTRTSTRTSYLKNSNVYSSFYKNKRNKRRRTKLQQQFW